MTVVAPTIRRVAILTDAAFRADRLFAEGSRDGTLEPYRRLRECLAERGCLLHTADVYERAGERPDIVLCMDAPARCVAAEVPSTWTAVPKWVILNEPDVVLPRNWDPAVQRQFDRLFTWRDSLVDDRRFFKLNGPNPICAAPPRFSDRDRFCTLIAANKVSSHPLELYSKRRAAIRWFERHHPEQFDLYGIGWDLLVPDGPWTLRATVAHLPVTARRLLAPRYPSYRGPIVAKRDILARYRFSICFENARDLDGYITEKLFDCLLAETIPVYWGAPNVTHHVPAACFVDFRCFSSYDELYDHLASLSEADCDSLRQAGRDFLAGELARPFSTEAWLETLLTHLV